MKTFSIFNLLILSLLISCGKNDKKGEDKPETGYENFEEYQDARDLNPDEMNLLKTICNSLKNKANYFNANSSRIRLEFRVLSKQCNQSGLVDLGRVGLQVRQSRNTLEFFAPRNNSLPVSLEIETFYQGYLSQVCPQAEQDINPTDSFDYNTRKMKLAVVKDQNVAVLRLARFGDLGDGKLRADQTLTYWINTALSTNDTRKHGIVLKRGEINSCGDIGQKLTSAKVQEVSSYRL